VSANNIFAVTEYIKNQREHHKEFDFKYEMINYYKEYKIDYDEKIYLGLMFFINVR